MLKTSAALLLGASLLTPIVFAGFPAQGTVDGPKQQRKGKSTKKRTNVTKNTKPNPKTTTSYDQVTLTKR